MGLTSPFRQPRQYLTRTAWELKMFSLAKVYIFILNHKMACNPIYLLVKLFNLIVFSNNNTRGNNVKARRFVAWKNSRASWLALKLWKTQGVLNQLEHSNRDVFIEFKDLTRHTN